MAIDSTTSSPPESSQTIGEEKARRLELLRRWDSVGQGHTPLPSSPEEFDKLPLTTKLAIQDKDPDLYRTLSPTVPLPAGTELRLAQGIEALLPEDVDPLLAAGYGDVVRQLRTRYLEGIQATHEANRAAEMEARKAWEAEAETRRQASQEEFNAKMRRHYVSTIGQGLPPSPPTAPTIPAILRR